MLESLPCEVLAEAPTSLKVKCRALSACGCGTTWGGGQGRGVLWQPAHTGYNKHHPGQEVPWGWCTTSLQPRPASSPCGPLGLRSNAHPTSSRGGPVSGQGRRGCWQGATWPETPGCSLPTGDRAVLYLRPEWAGLGVRGRKRKGGTCMDILKVASQTSYLGACPRPARRVSWAPAPSPVTRAPPRQ